MDANQSEIVQALRDIGCSVIVTSHIPSFVDLVVGYHYRTMLLEVKDGQKAKLKPSQEKLLATWRGHYAVVRNVQDALDVVREGTL